MNDAEADPVATIELAEAIVHHASAAGETTAQVYALWAVGVAARLVGRIEVALDRLDAAVTLAGELGLVELEGRVRTTRAASRFTAGQPEAAFADLDWAVGHLEREARGIARDARDIAFSVPSAASGKPGPASAESSITDDARLAKAIEAQYDADPSAVEILNLSLGTYGCGLPPGGRGPGRDVLRPPGMRALLLALHEKSPDLVVVASAGNDQSADRFYPAAFADDACFQARPVRSCEERVGRPASTQSPWLIAVGSDDPSYSNFGDWVTVEARGTDVVSVRPTTWSDINRTSPQDDGGWWRWSGTSFAAPCVAAQIAIDGQVAATMADVLRDVEATGRPVGCGLEGP